MARTRRARRVDDVEERRHQEDLTWAQKAFSVARQNRNAAILGVIATLVVALIPVIWDIVGNSPVPQILKARTQLEFCLLRRDRSASSFENAKAAAIRHAGSIPLNCDRWLSGWLARDGGAPIPGGPVIQISSPRNADATVTNVSVNIFRSYRPSVTSYINCVSGAGAVAGTFVHVDLQDLAVLPTLTSLANPRPLAMPGAVDNIDPGHTEYLQIVPKASAGFYEWSVTLTIVVDQHATRYTFGSTSRPLRTWFGPTPSNYLTCKIDSWCRGPARRHPVRLGPVRPSASCGALIRKAMASRGHARSLMAVIRPDS